MIYTIQECKNIIANITPQEVYTNPHFDDRIRKRGLHLTNNCLKYIQHKPCKITYANGKNRFRLEYYCEPLKTNITIIIAITEIRQIVLVTIY